jgi:hypothetical protein
MSLPSPPDPDILDLFKGAILGFRSDLNDEGLYSEILTTTSVKQVHDLVERIQQHQSKAGHLRNLSKIQQYLDKMDLYAGAIDAYVQVQPDILAFIWGPINLLIQWTGTVTRSATQDVIVNVIADIGDLLPDFTGMAALSHEKGLGDRLFLFFQDILDFYSVTLLFFNLSRKDPIAKLPKHPLTLARSRVADCLRVSVADAEGEDRACQDAHQAACDADEREYQGHSP